MTRVCLQVINFTMPNTVKHYVHRVGRTARAGKVGRSVSLVGETERKMLKEIVKKAKTAVKARVIPQGKEASSCVELNSQLCSHLRPNLSFKVVSDQSECFFAHRSESTDLNKS